MKWLFTLLLAINLVIYLVWIRGQDQQLLQHPPEIEAPEEVGQIRLLSELPPTSGEEEMAAEPPQEPAPESAQEPDAAAVIGEDAAEATDIAEVAMEEADAETGMPEEPETAEVAESSEMEPAGESNAFPFVAEMEEPSVETVARCGSLAGLADRKSADEALHEIESEDLTASVVEANEKTRIGYWVLIPPFDSAKEAQRKIEELRSNGIFDVWHIRGGEAENAISLGMFSREENARKYREKMEAQGIDAELRPRYISKKGYRIQLRISGKPALVEEYWNSLGLRYPQLKLEESACQPIASGE